LAAALIRLFFCQQGQDFIHTHKEGAMFQFKEFVLCFAAT
jgi:hypothetical protein